MEELITVWVFCLLGSFLSETQKLFAALSETSLLCLARRLGQVDSARKHLCLLGKPSDPMELRKLEAVEKHMSKCADARKLGDWKAALMEADATIVSGADFSPHVRTQLNVGLDRIRTGIKCYVFDS